FAPGACVELCAGKSCGLQGEQVVTGRYAGAAHCDNIGGARGAEELQPKPAQFGGGQKAAVGSQVAAERKIYGPRYVSRDRVQGLDLAVEALRRARIDQQT